MIEFILNDKKVVTDKPTGALLVDLIRYDQHLKGTKIGCREGDCGACTVLIGSLVDGKMKYINATSCLTPIANVAGKHVVTVEGLAMQDLSPVQQEMVNESGTQCGFCTPGFVVSLSNYCLSEDEPKEAQAVASVDGNICRCTGYKAIERAAVNINALLTGKDTANAIDWLIHNNFIPAYFNDIPRQIQGLAVPASEIAGLKLVGGGTDLYVQQPENLAGQDIAAIAHIPNFRSVKCTDKLCTIGGGTRVADLLASEELLQLIPDLKSHLKLVSSSPIRNISTIAGNFINASPIGDLTIMFLALNADIVLAESAKKRKVSLKEFFQGYKQLDKSENEIITEISFAIPNQNALFNLEKVSKRIHLDIASVNTAMQIEVVENNISTIHLSAGGVGPVPTYLFDTVAFLQNKDLNPANIKEANEVMQSEISPITDVRGTEEYKRLLLRQLFYAHFIKLFPSQFTLTSLK